ncbi:GntR family transcriptional regulator [Rhodopseudomonas palustris]|uniref:GntR family transcriptional regulator n=1 Tax=Rhodopseudomonas sp. BAL398 TaxID=3034676 RepID=UPI001F16952D
MRQEDIARQLDVSTTPVREAFRDLLAEGLISLDERRGAVVRGLTLNDVQEIYQMRLRLEPLLAERTFDAITDDGLDRAEACHRKMCGKVSAQNWATLNEEFHAALTGNASGSRLGSIVYNLAHAASPYVVLSLFAKPEIRDMNNRDHADLLALYRSRDRGGIVAKTERHLAQTLLSIEHEAEQKTANGHDDGLLTTAFMR